jgi:hypothetical protein
MSTNPNPPAVDQSRPHKNPLRKENVSVRVLGVFILLVEVGLLFAYGFSGYIINEVGSWGGSGAIPSLISP